MYLIENEKSTDKIIDLPSSKSVSHRILILSALNRGRSVIRNLLHAEDTQLTLEALRSMGSLITEENGVYTVTKPLGGVIKEKIFLGNSGSSARFLACIAPHLYEPVLMYGTERLHERPFRELFGLVRKLGGKIEADNESLPARFFPSELSGGVLETEGLPSSQIISGLMMSALYMENDLTLKLPAETPSLPYIRMTLELMKRLGFEAEMADNEIYVKRTSEEKIWDYTVEKDISSASYWVVYALINEADVHLPGVLLPTLQGDEKIFEAAEMAGGKVLLEEDNVTVSGRVTKGLDLDCGGIPDLVPALSVLALFAPEPSVIRNVKHLEYKECNRIEAIRRNIDAIGGKTEYDPAGTLTIYPQKKYHPAEIKTYNDHRIAMSFAIAGTRVQGLMIENPDCVKKSYPGFWDNLVFKTKELL